MSELFFLRWLQILLGVCTTLPATSVLTTEQYAVMLTETTAELHTVTTRAYAVGGGTVTLSVDDAVYVNSGGENGEMGRVYIVNGTPSRTAPGEQATPLPAPIYCTLPLRDAPHW